MSAAWVAGAVRGRLMVQRRLGPAAAREVARQASLAEATSLLSGTMYVAAKGTESLEEAERELASLLALQIRTLAAWLPPDGSSLLRALAGWFEVSNIEDRLAYLAGGKLWPPIPLGVLASIWDTASQIEDTGELQRILVGSSWGPPSGERPEDILLALRFGWARRVANQVPEAGRWASGAAAILLASELFLASRTPDPMLVSANTLGKAWPDAGSLAELRGRLPATAAWALAGIDDPMELWRAEPLWWKRVGSDAQSMLASGLLGRRTIVGVVGLLALDAVRLATALAVAAGSRNPNAEEVLNALC